MISVRMRGGGTCLAMSVGIEGRLVCVCEENPNLVAFVTLAAGKEVCKNALVLIVGLSDGFLALEYTEPLSRALLAEDYSLVLINLSSSWSQFGFQSLATDCEELEKHVSFLKTRFGFGKIVLLGHSTGAQDVVHFLRHRKPEVTSLVTAVILQGAISDREAMTIEPYASLLPSMKKEAEKLQLSGKGECLLSGRLFGAPITAKRLLSLAGRLTEDDMFSTDLTEEELDPILNSVKIPIQLCFSENDEYVPDIVAQKKIAGSMVKILKKYSSRVECCYFVGNHRLSEPKFYEPFIECVVKFVSTL